ncbi:putative quinol monooxygenase [Corynebacterium sp. CCM 9204]|uniref:putative quinol monooxygenase n=1 Tax=Corynebacterium sp. CCM 9204 TaxID=3057616 RepID=UPI003526B21D
MIRVIHTFGPLPDGLVDEVRALRGRVEQAEVYSTLAADEEEHALALLLPDDRVYGDLLRGITDHPILHDLLRSDGTGTAIYRQVPYALEGAVWRPLERPDPAVVWPARGPVDIVIQGAYEDEPGMRGLTAREISDTRREPGCLAYAWYENIELPNHLMLLETWADQQIYDAHWFGRTATSAYRGDSGRRPTPPERGEPVREFYRSQRFEFHYGRMLPIDVRAYSQTVEWSAS